MKNLKKALALVLAMSVTAVSGSALAAVEGTCTISGGTSSFTANYDVSAKSLTATATGAKVGEQMTFLILDKDANTTEVAADDILYVDQKAATSDDKSFTGTINLLRVTGATTEMPVGTYPVRFGYYNSNGAFQIGLGNLVISEVVQPAVQSITTDATATATAGTPLAITATVTAVGGASTEYTWAVTSAPNGANASVTNGNFVADKIGTYVVTATAEGDNTKTATKTITVNDAAPLLTSASIDGDSAAYTDETVTLTGSYVDGEKENVTLTWSVSGNATLSTNTGATTVVTPTVAGDVTVTLTATSATGVVVTDTHTITFTERPVEPTERTITIVWGDVNSNGAANIADATSLVTAIAGGTASWTKTIDEVAYTFSFNSDTVTAVEKSYTMKIGDDTVKWGDVNTNGAANIADATSLVTAIAGGTSAWLGSAVAFNANATVTLTEQE